MVDRYLTVIPEETVVRTAEIVGPQSAAARALKDAKARRAAGEDVAFYRERSEPNAILVGPRYRPPAADPDPAKLN